MYKLDEFLRYVQERNPNEPEFLQAVEEFAKSVIPYVNTYPVYEENKILERMVEPERVISFKVTWEDDNGEINVNKGYRVQFNSAIGPYKGGLRFHPTVNQSILKFLGFEQIFKNSLTTLPLGGGKGGSDFDPKGKSDREVMRFTQAFMKELFRHIGPDTDVPAGDIGVGAREIGYLFGEYKKIRNEFGGVLTGKSYEWGGSNIRPEATGYGLIYFVKNMLEYQNDILEGKKVLVSGSGNVAQYAVEKAISMGAKVLTMSDSSGYIFDKDGIDEEKLGYIMKLKNEKRGRLKEYAEKYEVEYFEGKKPWEQSADIALPCATQNEIDKSEAESLVANGISLIAEGSNMPSTNQAINVYLSNGIAYAPGKASNAGGVAVSGLEMSQNSSRIQWTKQEVDYKLQEIMKSIHSACVLNGSDHQGDVNYVDGANIAGFQKVAKAMIDQGI